ncbi:MAG: hypothetical protein H6721_31650 [Sandaracinus sp.]|nr:hypothetical protein [Sandaracinus sp.]MCB9636689.1 hypothetical protein [Sandaracinus sp.]
MRFAALLLCFSLVACATGGDELVGSEGFGLEGRVATLEFTGDFQTVVDGELVAGGLAHVVYDASRLTTCRGDLNGGPAWSIQAHYRIDGGDVQTLPVAGFASAPDQIGLPIELTEAGELEVWFENTSVWGCQGWDSAFGNNYRFAIAPAPAPEGTDPVVRFPAEGGFSVEGTPRQAGQLVVEYDVSRLTTCRGRYRGYEAWSMLAWFRFPSGRTVSVPVTEGRGVLDLYEGGEVEIWIENQNYAGCRAWDSLGGANYRLTVEADPRAPGWIGNGASVINRMTCDGPCDQHRVALSEGFTHGTYARQRAAIRGIYFDVWKEGVTDFDNANLWADLDVQVHFRASPSAPFQSAYVDFFRRVGNDARYQLPMSVIDPIGGSYRRTDPSQCPTNVDLLTSGDPSNAYVAARVEYYFTVNGVPYRNGDRGNFVGTFEEYRDLFSVCLD